MSSTRLTLTSADTKSTTASSLSALERRKILSMELGSSTRLSVAAGLGSSPGFFFMAGAWRSSSGLALRMRETSDTHCSTRAQDLPM
jgi:hypothetical protein